MASVSTTYSFAETALPKVTILGKSFYYYESKKGETLKDIAASNGWDSDVLANTNKELGTGVLDKGTLIYYPAPPANKKKDDNKAVKGAPVKHTVKSGETVYGISKQYNVPLESIYALNPTAREGIQSGQELSIMPWSENDITLAEDSEAYSDGYLFHRVEKDESLYGIAKKYTTSVEDLYRLNPGLSANSLKAGELIKVQEDTKASDIHTETVKEDHLDGLKQYKVRRGDTWSSIARDNGIEPDLLRQANPNITSLHRGDMIAVPEVKIVDVEKTYIAEDPRESTEEGRKELYNEVHDIETTDQNNETSTENTEVSVAIVLDDPDSNKDMEFARGAIVAVEDLSTCPFKTRLNIIDGTLPMGEIIAALDAFSPSIVVTTSDKNMPGFIADYGLQNKVAVVNAFDVKNESYINNPQIIQYLAPTSYFNDEIVNYLTENYSDYSLITAGEPDSGDTLAEAVIRSYSRNNPDGVEQISLSEIKDATLDMAGKYLIYATPSGKDDTRQLLADISTLRESFPLAQIKVLGRPNWITFAEAIKEQMGDNYVMMPTRFYFDANEIPNKDFISSFKTIYGHTPVKSFPVYSATAYDIMTFFVPNFAQTGGDLNAPFVQQDSLQSSIHLQRVSNWGGIVNPDVYIIDFMPFDMKNKITLPIQ